MIELADWRNKWAHIKGGDMTIADAGRALDTMSRLLEAMGSSSAKDIQALEREVRERGYEKQTPVTPPLASVTSQPAPAQPVAQTSSQPTVQAALDFGLRPWREVITPHRDVAEGRYQQAEFAADLADVLAGKAEPEYQDPVEFFARTYLTEGMKNLLHAAIERIGGKGGEPVVQLKTAFGGGKTHTMLALYHLLRGKGKLDKLAGVKGLLEASGLTSLPKASIAVLVGTDLNPSRPRLNAASGVETRTLWGEMAVQLGGREGYELVRDADERGVSPGAATLIELFDRFGPCVVLIDELVAYARNIYNVPDLPSGSFESVLTFVQSLTEAAKRSKRSMIVAAIPESDMEVGGAAGQEALDRIEKTFGRVEAVWKPVGALEGFEIVRRRLFTQVKDDNAREQVCLAYARLYGGESPDFPRECGEAAYLERLRAAYPIHPDIFDRLYDDWSSLERFQRTRGVLRLMAAAIHELWVGDDRSYLIQPGTMPLHAPRVRDELLRYLPDGWNTVMDRDVAGDRSEPQRIDATNPRYMTFHAAERLARTIFLGSAPHVFEQNVRGMEDVRIRLGVAQPGEPIAVYNDALGRLAEQLTYLYHDRRRYWYDTRPNLRRTAEDRASRFDPYEVSQLVISRLKRIRERGDFAGVHWCPDRTGGDVPDEQTVRLVVLGPDYPYSRSRNDSPAMEAASHILEHRGSIPRQHRNMLAFVAPDEEATGGLLSEVRRFLAWESIIADDKRSMLNLDNVQRRQATDALNRADETVDLRLQETYSWLLVPQQEGTQQWTFDLTQIRGNDSLVARASHRLRETEQLIVRWSPALLKMELDRWIWRDAERIETRKLWGYFCSYIYLPRLRDESVLIGAIADGVGSRDYFGYARSVSSDGKYEGLIFDQGTLPSSITIDAVSVLVKPEAVVVEPPPPPPPPPKTLEELVRKEVERDPSLGDHVVEIVAEGRDVILRAELPDEESIDRFLERVFRVGDVDQVKSYLHVSGTPAPAAPRVIGRAEPPPPPPPPPPPVRLKTRYHASVDLDPLRVPRNAGDIATEVIQHLITLNGARVTVSLEIEADVPDGIPDTIVNIVLANGSTLKFRSQEFEEE